MPLPFTLHWFHTGRVEGIVRECGQLFAELGFDSFVQTLEVTGGAPMKNDLRHLER